jgi:hypothetical protein
MAGHRFAFACLQTRDDRLAQLGRPPAVYLSLDSGQNCPDSEIPQHSSFTFANKLSGYAVASRSSNYQRFDESVDHRF